jgi:hypothetical protein
MDNAVGAFKNTYPSIDDYSLREIQGALMIPIPIKRYNTTYLVLQKCFFSAFFRLRLSLNITIVLSTCTPTADNVIVF